MKNISLEKPQNVILPPLHIKLGIKRKFVKATDKTNAVFKYRNIIFPSISDSTLKEGIFLSPQMRKLMQ